MKISTKMQNENSGSKEFWKSVKHITGKSKTKKQIGPIADDQEELVLMTCRKLMFSLLSFQQLVKS